MLIQSENVVTKHVEQAVLARFMPFRGGYVAVMRKESTRIGNGGAVGCSLHRGRGQTRPGDAGAALRYGHAC